ncbi:hypothetical protein BH11PSE14_BH11PSE14_21810 [soil metagenome]
MSHITGTVQILASPVKFGPDFGPASGPPNTWAVAFPYTPAPSGGTKLLMLHFVGASLSGNNRIEVDLGYGGEKDVFTSADGTEFWTRPINPYALVGGTVKVRYISNGAATGGVQIDRYGRGERHTKDPDNPTPLLDSYSNCDPFLDPAGWVEPDYAKLWFCNTPPNWENVDCVKPPGNIRNQVAPAVGMIVHADFNDVLGFVLSTCSVTLIAPDIVITAGHCLQDPIEDANSGSIIFGYQVNCNGSTPGGYSPKVHKVKEVIAQRFADGTSNDYCLLRLATPVVGITPVAMRNDLPSVGEQVFGIHHPNGAVKKISPIHPAFAAVNGSFASGIGVSLDVSGGSSGSGLFDSSGRIVGVLSAGGACSLSYFPTASIQQDMAAPPPVTRDVMLVFDRSGSMSLPGTSGQPKIHEAAAAASLFVQLVRANTGNRIGLVSFSTAASSPVDNALADVTAAHKAVLVGPSPYTSGIIGTLVASGATAMGQGLNAAYAQLSSGSNPRNILLLTDGLQNVPPMVNPLDASPAGIAISAIGYGTPASLDGDLLTAIANTHRAASGEHGHYVLADTNLKLQKFFALAFGNIFEAGLLMDPEFMLPAGQQAAAPLPFSVCEEEALTVVVGWDHRDTPLRIEVDTPADATIGAGSPGVESAAAPTWTFLRIALPQGGERDGTWNVRVFRPDASGAPRVADSIAVGAGRERDAHYFVNVIATGGAVLRRMPDTRIYYTGDVINPLVGLQYLKGGMPPGAKLTLSVLRPDASVGSLLSRERLGPARVIAADTIPPRQATLQAIEAKTGKPAVGYTAHQFPMFDDIVTTGSPEPAGVFGNKLDGLLTVEGQYSFHVRASYGDGCTTTRELLFTVHVSPGIDPGHSEVSRVELGNRPALRFVPRDRYGNDLGPGAGDRISVSPAIGTTLIGPIRDNGDGSYTVAVSWDADKTSAPGIVIGQPGRGAVVLSPAAGNGAGGGGSDGLPWRWLFWLVLLVAIVLLLIVLIVLTR